MADLFAILRHRKSEASGPSQVGNKAWNLMRLAELGLPVPPAFVLPTDWCRDRRNLDETALNATLSDGIAQLESATGLGFGASYRPLLVSVRSGAAVSMPGMMETVLDIGLNADTVEGLICLTGNPRLAWDSYRRLIQGYAEVVENLATEPFELLVALALTEADVTSDRDLDHRSLRTLAAAMLETYETLSGHGFPKDPYHQLTAAVHAVFRSWEAPKAISYRHMNRLEDSAGTAVTVQTMVYGNAGSASGAGVAFTRNPSSGAPGLYFDFQFNAQGEDVVAGRHKVRDNDRLAVALPAIWNELKEMCSRLEKKFRDVQDFEFTVQSGVLFLLQTRDAKRTDWAAIVIATDLVSEGLINPSEALAKLVGIDLKTVVAKRFKPPLPDQIAIAEIASMGVASGAIALDADAVERLTKAGTPAILVSRDTVTSDFEGMAKAVGILTASGGRTSHAAVIARQLNKVCLVACPRLSIQIEDRRCEIGGIMFAEYDFISLDGNTGCVYAGKLDAIEGHPVKALATIEGWQQTNPKPTA